MAHYSSERTLIRSGWTVSQSQIIESLFGWRVSVISNYHVCSLNTSKRGTSSRELRRDRDFFKSWLGLCWERVSTSEGRCLKERSKTREGPYREQEEEGDQRGCRQRSVVVGNNQRGSDVNIVCKDWKTSLWVNSRCVRIIPFQFRVLFSHIFLVFTR